MLRLLIIFGLTALILSCSSSRNTWITEESNSAYSDLDRDGITDKFDQCPEDPEDRDGFEDEDGCPELDNDLDGVPDKDDWCSNEKGPAEFNGCPEETYRAYVKQAEENRLAREKRKQRQKAQQLREEQRRAEERLKREAELAGKRTKEIAWRKNRAGMGIYMDKRQWNNIILGVLKNSPADKAGILPGDEIKHVNGIWMKERAQTVLEKLWGDDGERITLQIKRRGRQGYLEKTVTLQKGIENLYSDPDYNWKLVERPDEIVLMSMWNHDMEQNRIAFYSIVEDCEGNCESGTGTVEFKNGPFREMIYSGEWYKGKAEGKGTLGAGDNKLTGKFDYGRLKEGKWFVNGKLLFEGEFGDWCLQKGTLYIGRNRITNLTGSFIEGRPSGKMILKNFGPQSYDGEVWFEYGVPVSGTIYQNGRKVDSIPPEALRELARMTGDGFCLSK